MKDLTKAPTPRTLMHFILPVASGFLCSEKYAHKNNVVDAAVEVSCSKSDELFMSANVHNRIKEVDDLSDPI
jgi:hypothetical protein